MGAIDLYPNTTTPGLDSTLAHLAVITPSDSADVAYVTRAVYLNIGGDLKVTTLGGETVTMPLGAGWHPIRLTRIWATGTTATGIVAGW